MELGPVCGLGNRPRMLVCYLCGREYGIKSLSIHIPQCQKKWLIEEEKKPKNERRPLPPQPNAEKAIGNGGARAFDNFNVEAYAAFEQTTLEQCPYCQRRFLPKPFKTHQKGCSAAKPAKPAGTGLIKYSLTNRLVPGAVAGSMHGKAKKQPLPLRLCRPPPKSKPKLKSTQRPAWTGAGGGSPFDEVIEDHQLPLVQRHKPSAQEWCLQAETSFSSTRGTNPGQSSHKNRLLAECRNSSQNRNGRGTSGGDSASHLVKTFRDFWRSHREENLNNPIAQRAHQSVGAKEWFVPAETTNASSFRRTTAHPRQKTNSTFSSAQSSTNHRQSPSAALRSLDFVGLTTTLPAAASKAGRAGAAHLMRGGDSTTGHQRPHRRSPGFQ